MDDVPHVPPREYLAGVRMVGGTALASAAMLVTCGWLAIGGGASGTSRGLDEPDPVQLDVAGTKVAPVPHRTAAGTPVVDRTRTRRQSPRIAPHRITVQSPRRSSTPTPSPTPPAPAPTSEPSPPPAATPAPALTVAPPQLPAPVELPTVTLPAPAVPSVPVVDQVVSAVGLP